MKKVFLLFIVIVLVCTFILASCDDNNQHKHTIVIDEAIEATCSNTGLTEGKHCSECGEVLIAQEVTPLATHVEEVIPEVKSTCTYTGLTEGIKCSVCGEVLLAQYVIPIKAHVYDDKYDDTCNECGYIRDAACAHTDTEIIKGKDATCTEIGYTDEEKCKQCGEIVVEQTIISIKPHTEVIDAGVEATCTETGLTEGKHCSVCGAIIIPQLTIDAQHTFGAWKEIKEPTASELGECKRECIDCGETEIAGHRLLNETIEIWVPYDSYDMFENQIENFLAKHPEYVNIQIELEEIHSQEAGYLVTADLDSAPDIYCFEQNLLARLVKASALSAPTKEIADSVKANNDKGAVNASSIDGTLYAYPMTNDNGYYMYYDNSIITNPDSLEQIIADVEAYNAANPDSPKWIRFALENAWYSASFFFATDEDGNRLCHSNWITDPDGNFISFDDNFNSDNGVIAMRGMMKLAQSSAYNSDADVYADSAVWITGIWNAATAEEYFGENLAATDLPSFTVDGKSYHLGSYTGNKLIGVKPQSNPIKEEFLHKLAEYLVGEECQLQRYNEFLWNPSNLNVQASDALQANQAFAALSLQSNFGVPQGEIYSNWWYVAKSLGVDAKTATSIDDLRKALELYETTCKTSFEMGQ